MQAGQTDGIPFSRGGFLCEDRVPDLLRGIPDHKHKTGYRRNLSVGCGAAVYILYSSPIINNERCFAILICLTAIGFLVPVQIKKPKTVGKVLMTLVGVAEAVLKGLVSPWVSKAAGKFLNSGASRPLVSYYIAKYHIDIRRTEECAGIKRSPAYCTVCVLLQRARFRFSRRTAGSIR